MGAGTDQREYGPVVTLKVKKNGNSLAIGKPMGEHRLKTWEDEMKGNPVGPGDLSPSKPTWWNASGPTTTSAFFRPSLTGLFVVSGCRNQHP